MAERHTKGGSPGGSRSGIGPTAVPGHRTVSGDDRSDLTRAAGLTGWRPYVRRDDSEPPAVLAARARWRAREAELAVVRAEQDAEPDPSPPERCDACGYLTTAPGHRRACGDA